MAVETSIVIRTLNEAKHLELLLDGIHQQNYSDWEIILVDSGSTDTTLDIAQKYGANIYHIDQKEFTFGRALNLGCEKAQGRYLVFASGHVWPVSNNWLRNLVKPFEEPSVAMVYGRQRGTELNRLSEIRDLETIYGATSSILLDEPKGNNGNAAVRRKTWECQRFDESLSGLEDIDWARKVQRKGDRVFYAADAVVYHVHEESLKQVYRRYLRESIAYKQMFPAHRYTRAALIRGYVYLVVRDVLYATRKKKLRKIPQVPLNRFAQFVGTYNGYHYQRHHNLKAALTTELPQTYKKLVIDGPGRHDFQDSELPQLAQDEVLIRVGYVGVCATDLEVANGTLEYYRTGRALYPIVPGHEYSGVVAKTGTSVKGFSRGQKVVGECAIGCGDCPACSVEDYYRCESRKEVGVINVDGAYAHYMVMPAKYLHKLPDDVPLKYGVVLEPVAVCLKGIRKLKAKGGSAACVVGAGSIGNLCAQILRARGLRVTVVDPEPRRLQLLHKYDIDTLEELGSLSVFDYVVEASGNETVIPDLIENSKPSAKILLLGLPYNQPVQATFSTVTSYDKIIYGSVASQQQDWKEAIQMVRSGAIGLDDHTAIVEPLEAYREAWVSAQAGNHFKLLLSVNKELESL